MRPRTKIVCAVELDPGVDLFEVIEHSRTIDDEVANVGKLLHRLKLDRLLEIIN